MRRLCTVYLGLYFAALAALYARKGSLAFGVNETSALQNIGCMLIAITALYGVVAHRALLLIGLVILWQSAAYTLPYDTLGLITLCTSLTAGLSMIATHERYQLTKSNSHC